MITYLDDILATFVAEAGADGARMGEVAAAAGLNESATVRDLMGKGASGAVVYALTGVWPVPSGTEVALAIKGSTTPTDIKEMVEDPPPSWPSLSSPRRSP